MRPATSSSTRRLYGPAWQAWRRGRLDPAVLDGAGPILSADLSAFVLSAAASVGRDVGTDELSGVEESMMLAGARAAVAILGEPVLGAAWPSLAERCGAYVADIGGEGACDLVEGTRFRKEGWGWHDEVFAAEQGIAERLGDPDVLRSGTIFFAADFGAVVVLLAHFIPWRDGVEAAERVAVAAKAARRARRARAPRAPAPRAVSPLRIGPSPAQLETANRERRAAAEVARARLAEAFATVATAHDEDTRGDALRALRQVALEVGAADDAAWAKAQLHDLRHAPAASGGQR